MKDIQTIQINLLKSTDESKEQSKDFDKKEIIQNEKDFWCLFNQTKYFFPEYVVPTLLLFIDMSLIGIERL